VHGDKVCRALAARGSQSRVLTLTAAGSIEDRGDGLEARLGDTSEGLKARGMAFRQVPGRARMACSCIKRNAKLRCMDWSARLSPGILHSSFLTQRSYLTATLGTAPSASTPDDFGGKVLSFRADDSNRL
jgi:hypothetical protein